MHSRAHYKPRAKHLYAPQVDYGRVVSDVQGAHDDAVSSISLSSNRYSKPLVLAIFLLTVDHLDRTKRQSRNWLKVWYWSMRWSSTQDVTIVRILTRARMDDIDHACINVSLCNLTRARTGCCPDRGTRRSRYGTVVRLGFRGPPWLALGKKRVRF